jgi:hypothetical protein
MAWPEECSIASCPFTTVRAESAFLDIWRTEFFRQLTGYLQNLACSSQAAMFEADIIRETERVGY